MRQYLVFGIFLFLSGRNHTTAKEIADKFEISTRTVYRYIDALCMAGIPIITQVGANGGVKIDKNFSLENFVLSKHEKAGLKNSCTGDVNCFVNKICR